ncbi:MAG: putative peptide maturation dehydrogenase [Acidimicrobiales bacterium]
MIALSALAGQELVLTMTELAMLLAVPEDAWVDVSTARDAAGLARLATSGLVVSESGDGQLAEYRRREAQLRAPAWNRNAAVFHAMTRWSGVRSSPTPVRQSRDPDRWPPPKHFHDRPVIQSTRLPVPGGHGDLYEVLGQRRTTVRGFAPEAAVSLDQLSTILHWVWGCHGTRVISPGELTLVRKTSPSGGAQHPTEVYPLVRNVPGVEPGLYHYDVEHHALGLLDGLAGQDLIELNNGLLADQSHFASAPVVFYVTCRFARTFWKYPRHAKAFKVVLFDAAHLSQTLQLVCAQMQLGSFVTAAFNEVDVDRLLGVQEFTEGSLLALGCGHPANPTHEPVYEPVVGSPDGRTFKRLRGSARSWRKWVPPARPR